MPDPTTSTDIHDLDPIDNGSAPGPEPTTPAHGPTSGGFTNKIALGAGAFVALLGGVSYYVYDEFRDNDPTPPATEVAPPTDEDPDVKAPPTDEDPIAEFPRIEQGTPDQVEFQTPDGLPKQNPPVPASASLWSWRVDDPRRDFDESCFGGATKPGAAPVADIIMGEIASSDDGWGLELDVDGDIESFDATTTGNFGWTVVVVGTYVSGTDFELAFEPSGDPAVTWYSQDGAEPFTDTVVAGGNVRIDVSTAERVGLGDVFVHTRVSFAEGNGVVYGCDQVVFHTEDG